MLVHWDRLISVIATPDGLLVTEKSDSTLGASPVLVPYVRASGKRQLMRDLWDEHVALTRMVIVEFFAGHPGLEATLSRLLANQDALGQLAGSAELARLLREHIKGAHRLLAAVKSKGDVTAQKNFWYANGDQIAVLLSSVWQCGRCTRAVILSSVQAMMRTHLDTTLAEAAAEAEGKWAESLTAYDRARAHVLEMAERISDGLGYEAI